MKKSNGKPKRITSMYLEADLWKRLRRVALERNTSASVIVNELIRERLRELEAATWGCNDATD